jgi:hypothetical protein
MTKAGQRERAERRKAMPRRPGKMFLTPIKVLPFQPIEMIRLINPLILNDKSLEFHGESAHLTDGNLNLGTTQ